MASVNALSADSIGRPGKVRITGGSDGGRASSAIAVLSIPNPVNNARNPPTNVRSINPCSRFTISIVGNYRLARSNFKSGPRNPSEAKSPQNRRRHAHALNFVVELFGQGSACRLDLRARHLEPAKKRHEGTQAFRPAKKDSAHGILRAAHADRVLCPRGIGSVMIQPINVKRDRRRPGRRWRSVLGHGIGFLPPDRVAVPVRPHSRWARDLVLDFGGRDGLCADDTRLSRPPSRNDSPTCRKECPARKAISNLSPQFAIGQTCHPRIPPVTGKELCGQTGGKARGRAWYRPCLWRTWGSEGAQSDRDDRLRGGLAPGG